MDNSETANKEVYAALQEFKTCFDLAKSTAGNQPKSTTKSEDNEEGSSEEIKSKPLTLEVPQVIEGFLEHVSKIGAIIYPWKVVKPFLLFKLDAAMRSYNSRQPFDSVPSVPNCAETTFSQMYTSILKATDKFKQAPFTVQRICELICFPERHYKRIDKYMYALEKNTAVVTTVDEKGRKLSTSAETDLSVTDPQQTDKLIALFDSLNTFTSNGTTCSSHAPSTDTSPSTSSQLTRADTYSHASMSTDNTNAECSTSMDSTDVESVQEPASRSVKRSMSEDGMETDEQVNKKVRLDMGDELGKSSLGESEKESTAQTSESSSDVAVDTANTQSVGDDVTSQSSDTLTDSIAEDLPVDEPMPATSDNVKVTSHVETDIAVSESSALAEENSALAEIPVDGDVAEPTAADSTLRSSADDEQKAHVTSSESS